MKTYLYKRDEDGQLFQLWYDRSCRSWYGNECRDPMAVRPVEEQSRRTCVLRQQRSALARRWVRIGWMKLNESDYELEVNKPAEFTHRREELEELFGLKRLECLGVLTREEVVR